MRLVGRRWRDASGRALESASDSATARNRAVGLGRLLIRTLIRFAAAICPAAAGQAGLRFAAACVFAILVGANRRTGYVADNLSITCLECDLPRDE
ncbi:hypothetical protein GGR51DRAFT_554226 [Nemania sp. FL0031]|nr:hypothetical protein GGR51DRAFT_554226 [Nemania sp. FL0031]